MRARVLLPIVAATLIVAALLACSGNAVDLGAPTAQPAGKSPDAGADAVVDAPPADGLSPG